MDGGEVDRWMEGERRGRDVDYYMMWRMLQEWSALNCTKREVEHFGVDLGG